MSICKKYFVLCTYSLIVFFFSTQIFAHTTASLQNLKTLQKKGARVTAVVQCLEDGKILGEISPEQHLIPASVTKIALASQAIDTWGANKTFRSVFFARGKIYKGVLNGDLIFYGGGDPAFINENMPELLSKIKRLGLKKITGQVVVNNSLFGALKQDKARASHKKYSQNAYDAPLSAAAINYSVLEVSVKPSTKIGSKAVVSIQPYSIPSAFIINKTKTGSKGSRTSLVVERSSTPEQDYYTVTGSIAQNAKERKFYRSVSNPNRYAGEMIAAFLRSSGVLIANKNVKIENKILTSKDKMLVSVSGSPLSNHLNGLLKQSNNFIADMLLLDLNLENGYEFQTEIPFTIKDQSTVLEKYLQSITHDKNLVIKSGSGLTPENRLSSQNITSLLNKIYQDKEKFQIFLNSLTTPGEIGTLKRRFNQYSFQKNHTALRAKTGTLSSPYNVVSLAGYARTKENEWIAFAIIVNSQKKKNAPSILKIQNAIDKDVISFL